MSLLKRLFGTRQVRRLLSFSLALGISAYYLLDLNFDGLLTGGDSFSLDPDLTPKIRASMLQVRQYNRDGALNYLARSERLDVYSAYADTATELATDDPLLNNSFDEELAEFEPLARDANRNEEHAHLLAPHIEFPQDDGSLVTIHADHAYLTAGGENIELVKAVTMIDSANQATLRTERLLINSELRQVLSEQPVSIDSPGITTSAVGVEGNVTQRSWRLLSDVRSVVQPYAD